MKRVQLFNGRYTKGLPFLKNSIYKDKGLELGAKPLRTMLYWVASHPPPLLTRAFHKLLGNFLARSSISSNFLRFKELLHNFWAISLTGFLPILRYLSSFWCLNWPCFHIAECFSRQFMNLLWKRSQMLTPWGQIIGARSSRAARSGVFLNKIQNGGRWFKLDWHECLRWRRSFNNFNGSY